MVEVKCIYCGEHIPEDVTNCPHCGSPSHFQRRGERLGASHRFIIFFVFILLLCTAMIFWLPR